MQLTTILLLVGVLACPIVMGLMMWMMNRNMNDSQGHSMSGHNMHTSESDRLAMLHEQRRLLEQEIAEAEKIAALEAKKQALAAGSRSDGVTQPAKDIRS